MARRYLGYGVTNNSGVATLDHAPDGTTLSHSYTGVGAGKIDVVAESGSLQSETYSILDCNWYDDGVTSPKTVTWWKPSSNFTETIEDTGTTITNSTSSTNHYWVKNYSQIDIGAFVVEFDLLSYTDDTTPRFAFTGTGGGNYIFKTELEAPQQCHVKFIVDGTKIACQIDNGTPNTLATTTNTTFYVGFRLNGEGSIKFKDFKVYPI